LSFHLLLRGVEAEDQSGRAPLPRRLQVWKDAEEVGQDRLVLADIHRRLQDTSKARFDGKLLLDEFFPENSEENSMLQIADLFTSSINRVLNAEGERKQPKDQLADHLLEILRLPERPKQKE